MRPTFYNGAQCAFIVADLSRKETFDKISQYWLNDLRASITEPIPLILVANKNDLIQALTDDEINQITSKGDFVNWFKTSAKSGAGINDAFIELIKKCVQIDTLEPISL